MVQKPAKTQQRQDSLDLFVGLYSPLNDPFNVFLRVSDIESDQNLIYFYGYSIGKKKIVIWGVYDTTTQEFLIDDACQYHPNNLKGILESWKQNNFNFYFSEVRNRMGPRIEQYSIYEDRKSKIDLLKSFKQIYTQKLSQDGVIPGKYPGKFNENKYNQIMSEVGKSGLKAAKKEKYQKVITVLLQELESEESKRKIWDALSKNNFNPLTNYEMNVANHILVHLFLLVFYDIDDYRVAKYIKHISDQTHNNRDKKKNIKDYLKGMFMYEWIYNLAKVLRVYDTDKFVNKMADVILELTEDNL
jgi:hypothetical protein